LGSHARLGVNFDENESGEDTFTVDVNTMAECEMIMYHSMEYPFPPVSGPFCTFAHDVPISKCRCKFSNMPNMFAQTILLSHLPVPLPDGIPRLCPIIPGYTADPPIQMAPDCRYYANIRISDTNNTGFCLRYQAS